MDGETLFELCSIRDAVPDKPKRQPISDALGQTLGVI